MPTLRNLVAPRSWRLKRFLPTTLFGRAFLILVLPMLISQLFLAYVFFDRHWRSVERTLANSVIGDMVWLHTTFTRTNARMGLEAALAKTSELGAQLDVRVAYLSTFPVPSSNRTAPSFAEFRKGLSQRISAPISLVTEEKRRLVHVRMGLANGGALVFSVPRKSLSSPTTRVFLLYMIGSTLLLIIVATLFLRNQVRPIVELARVTEQLGLGQEVSDFKPHGASEVRRAGRAFLIMAERIRRHVQHRTEMLAGISHDLRTPLTRMKLELELATMDAVSRAALTADIDEMGHMIDEYLDFARGDAGELPEPVDLHLLLSDIAATYARSAANVHYTSAIPIILSIRPQSIRRALTNLIDNALRYGGGIAELALEQSAAFVRIKITDRGSGIPVTEQESVFKPFTRLEPSRNQATGGVGLGLSIARAIAQRHGGDVTLENQLDSSGAIVGLEVTLRLPRAVQPET